MCEIILELVNIVRKFVIAYSVVMWCAIVVSSELQSCAINYKGLKEICAIRGLGCK